MAEPISTATVAATTIAKVSAALEKLYEIKKALSPELYRRYLESKALADSVEKGEVEAIVATSALLEFRELQEAIMKGLEEVGLIETVVEHAGVADVVESLSRDVSEGLTRLATTLEEQGLKATLVEGANSVRRTLEESWEGARAGIQRVRDSEAFEGAVNWATKWDDHWREGGLGEMGREFSDDVTSVAEPIMQAGSEAAKRARGVLVEVPGATVSFILESPGKMRELCDGVAEFIREAPDKTVQLGQHLEDGFKEGENLGQKLHGVEEGVHRWLDESYGVN